jgi:DNA-binding MarR family transcriptional regulator
MTDSAAPDHRPGIGIDEAATQIGETLARISRRLRRISAQHLAPFGLTDGQARALRMVGRARSPLCMSEIARRIEVVPRSATTLIEGLEAKGFVVREIDTLDRRSILVRLTVAGAQLYQEIGRARDKAAVELFSHLEHADQLALLRLLDSVKTTGHPERAPLRPDRAGSATNEERHR